jgi:hypothetical protein
MKIDFVTKIRKVRSEKNIFFVEWLLFTGEDEIFRIEDKVKWAMMIYLRYLEKANGHWKIVFKATFRMTNDHFSLVIQPDIVFK